MESVTCLPALQRAFIEGIHSFTPKIDEDLVMITTQGLIGPSFDWLDGYNESYNLSAISSVGCGCITLK